MGNCKSCKCECKSDLPEVDPNKVIRTVEPKAKPRVGFNKIKIVEASAGVFIRNVRTRIGKDMVTYLIFTLGPTPHPIVTNPEEFSLDVSINIQQGDPFVKLVKAVDEIAEKGKGVYVNRSHVVQ